MEGSSLNERSQIPKTTLFEILDKNYRDRKQINDWLRSEGGGRQKVISEVTILYFCQCWIHNSMQLSKPTGV